MKQVNIQIQFDENKLEALKVFLLEKGNSVDSEVQKLLTDLYETIVPSDVKTYLEKRSVPEIKKPRKKRDNKLNNEG